MLKTGPRRQINTARANTLKAVLDPLVIQHKIPSFIPQDPIQFPWRFYHDSPTAQWVGLLSALLSYGRREKILEALERLLSHTMQQDPRGFLENFNYPKDKRLLAGFVYRFNTGDDIALLLHGIQQAQKNYGALEMLWQSTQKNHPGKENVDLKHTLNQFTEALIPSGQRNGRHGLKFLLTSPEKGGSAKRLLMYLRWMVRQEDSPENAVDLGLWKNSLKPANLHIPLDTHVAKAARALNLTQRNANDWQTVEEITKVLQKLCPEDPIRYDFALFHYGLKL